MLKIELLL